MKHSRKFSIKKVVSSCKNIKNIKLDKQHLYIIMALFFIGVFIVVLTSSYAFFSATIRGKEYVVSTGTLSVTFQSNNSSFNLTGQSPKKDSEGLNTTPYTFGVKNTGTLVARYQVRLVLDDSQSNIPLEYVKIAYKKNNGSYSDPIRLSDLNTNLVITSNDEIDPNDTDNFELKMWIDYDAPIEVAGKKFKGKIVIDAIQDSDDGYVVSGRPAIKLNKDSEGNIDMLLNVGDTFTDPGVEKVLDDKDVFTTSDVVVNSNVNTSVAGIYNVTYTVTDSDGNASNVVRTVAVGNEETLELYKTPAAVVTAYSTDANKKVVLCSHIYASTDIYFNCEEQGSITEAMSARNIGAIILKTDINKTNTTTITTGQEYLLVLNGHNIIGTMNNDNHSFALTGYAKLAIYGDNNSGMIGNNRSITARDNATIEIDGGNYRSIYVPYNASNNQIKVDIKNCHLEHHLTTDGGYVFWFGKGSEVNIDNVTIYSSGKALGWGQNAKVKVDNSTLECYQDNCIYSSNSENESADLEISNSTITSYGYGINNDNNGPVTLRNTTITAGTGNGGVGTGTYTKSKIGIITTYAGTISLHNSSVTSTGIGIQTNRSGGINLYNSTISSTGIAIETVANQTSGAINLYESTITTAGSTLLANRGSSTVNIYSGKYMKTGTATNSTIYNAATGTINIKQTDKPLYIYNSVESSWGTPCVYNNGTGNTYISGHQADNCTANANDTTTGLCMYSKGVTIRNQKTGKLNIDGGTYYGRIRGIYAVGTGSVNVQNAIITGVSGLDGTDMTGITNYSTAVVKICNTTFNVPYDIKNENNSNTCGAGEIYYSSDVIFSNGTNANPRTGNSCPDGTIELAENGVCPITAQDLQ